MNLETAPAFHVPVLAAPAVDLLVGDREGVYVDLTVGGGGHSLLIRQRLTGAGRLVACDRDREAVEYARRTLPPDVTLIHCRFSEADARLGSELGGKAAGVLMDLGVSSHQLDDPARGFSHRFSGPLDLRMDPTAGEPAAALLARLTLPELTRLIGEYGEDPQARRIARAIVEARARGPVTTTDDLARIVAKSVAATRVKSLSRVFQALRIAVNDELNELERGLQSAWNLLRPGGRLVVISYHSLEDRQVKTFMKSQAAPERAADDLFGSRIAPRGRLLLAKPLAPCPDEVLRNPRARSARLRAIEKLT